MVKDKTIQNDQSYELIDEIVSILLIDRSSNDKLIWATDTYKEIGQEFGENEHITLDLVVGKNSNVIKPRTNKSKVEQINRIKNKGEVFTPSWVCNKQNNLVDDKWFGIKNVFNVEIEHGWKAKKSKIVFPEGKTWKDYIALNRLEITCGEAPYIVSRYDSVSGDYIDVPNRIGILDRKLRVVGENTESEEDWCNYSMDAVKSIYAYDCQGDNVFLSRQNVLFTIIDYFILKFGHMPKDNFLIKIADVVSWNIWQMDGTKYVIPNSCHKESIITLLDDEETRGCPGCENDNIYTHNGIYSKIMDWHKGEAFRFIDQLNKRGF